MADGYGHLTPEAHDTARLPNAERIAWMRRRWFMEYPRCRQVLDLMEGQLAGTGAVAAPNLLVWGDPGQGKTTILHRHLRQHPIVADLAAGIRRTPVVAVEMPPVCDVRWFYDSAIQVLQWATPIVYPIAILPERYHPFVWYNPIARLVDVFRVPLTQNQLIAPQELALVLGIGGLAILVGLAVFWRYEERFINYL